MIIIIIIISIIISRGGDSVLGGWGSVHKTL